MLIIIPLILLIPFTRVKVISSADIFLLSIVLNTFLKLLPSNVTTSRYLQSSVTVFKKKQYKW